MNKVYLTNVRQVFVMYKELAEKAIRQINDEKLEWSPSAESNSIAVIIQHLCGNMRSRWTDFLTTDGEKDWRDRDAEFETRHLGRETLLELWEEGWQLLFSALDSLNETDLEKTVYIRQQSHVAVEAINRQLAHYAYHVGQIVYIAKMAAPGCDSLSIPKKKPVEFTPGKS